MSHIKKLFLPILQLLYTHCLAFPQPKLADFQEFSFSIVLKQTEQEIIILVLLNYSFNKPNYTRIQKINNLKLLIMRHSIIDIRMIINCQSENFNLLTLFPFILNYLQQKWEILFDDKNIYNVLLLLVLLMQQQEEQFNLKQSQQYLFDILTNQIIYQHSPYTDETLTADLVIKMSLPPTTHMKRQKLLNFGQLFINLPPQLQIAYQNALDYITFISEADCTVESNQQTLIRCMTSLSKKQQPQAKIQIVESKENDEEIEQVAIDCFYECLPECDSFNLTYNMIMLVLQQMCGFSVHSFILDNPNGKDADLYLLLYQNHQNLIHLANEYKIKKQIDMVQIDFFLNDPVDSKGRPLKLNSYFRNMEWGKDFIKAQKTMTRNLLVNMPDFVTQIKQETQLSKSEKQHFLKYSQQQYDIFVQIMESTYFKTTLKEKQYLHFYNRGKTNEKCQNYLKLLKKKHQFYYKCVQLNKKFGYQTYQHQNNFFQFRQLSRQKSFFDKLGLMLRYKSTKIGPFEDIKLFNNMQRIKLSYLSLQNHFKIQNFAKIEMQVFAINNNYERFGVITYEYGKQKQGINIGSKRDLLVDKWHGYIPFLTDIYSIRNYMGQNFAFLTLVKIHLISFFTGLAPIAIIAQFFLEFYVIQNNWIDKFNIGYLIVVVISLTIFQQTWKNKQNIFFNIYIETQSNVSFRDNYKGPYIRNIITDSINEYQQSPSFEARFVTFLTFTSLGILIMIQGFIFYGLRMGIISSYLLIPKIPQFFIQISLPHLIFYGIFFWSNFLIYKFAFEKIILKLVDLQNYPTKEQHQQILRQYIFTFTFGIQLIGPLFLYVIEPFQGTTCYAASCQDQFRQYIYSRYFIIFSFLLVKIIYAILYYFKGGIQKITNLFDFSARNIKNVAFYQKLNCLLQHIQEQQTKSQIIFDMREEALSLYYFCIYSMNIPFCSVLSLALLLLDYILDRIQILRTSRRPIPRAKQLVRLSGIYSVIIHTCIIVNSWAIFFTFQIVEYDLSFLIEQFLIQITKDNILILKIMLSVIFIVFLEIISYIFQLIFSSVRSIDLANRKNKLYKNSILRDNKKYNYLEDVDKNSKPIKTIFRVYNLQALLDQKRSRFKKIMQTCKHRDQLDKPKNAEEIDLQMSRLNFQRSRVNRPTMLSRVSNLQHKVASQFQQTGTDLKLKSSILNDQVYF